MNFGARVPEAAAEASQAAAGTGASQAAALSQEPETDAAEASQDATGTPPMQEKSKKAPNEAITTFGIQNSQAHSSAGVSMGPPGTPLYQKAQPVKAAPTSQHTNPTTILRRRLQSIWNLI